MKDEVVIEIIINKISSIIFGNILNTWTEKEKEFTTQCINYEEFNCKQIATYSNSHYIKMVDLMVCFIKSKLPNKCIDASVRYNLYFALDRIAKY